MSDRGWATKDDVLKNFRIVTSREAFLRQFFLSFAIAGILLGIGLIFHIFEIAICFIAAMFLLWPFSRFLLETLVASENPSAMHGNDTPVYADVSHKQGSITKFLSSRIGSKLAVSLITIIFSLGILYFLTNLPFNLKVSGLSVLYAGGMLYAIKLFVRHIEFLEIDIFSKKPKDKVLKWFNRKFADSRGAYFIGEVDNKKIGLPRNVRFMHSLVCAPTGEGKSASLIIPGLLFDADSIGSAVVPDSKSPVLFEWVAGRWLAKGKKVFLFDPWNPDTVGINFLPHCSDQDLLTFVEVIMREREEAFAKEESFFKSRTHYILYACLKLAQTFSDEYCNLSTIYHAVQNVETLDPFIKASNPQIQALFSDYQNSFSKDQRANALTSIYQKLDIFMDENVRKAFSRPDFDLSDLFKEKEPCLLIIGAPNDKKEPGTKIASFLINLIINIAFKERRLQKQAIQKGVKSFEPNDLYLYLDEIRSLKITALADLISIAREIKTHVIGSVTDLGFFKYYREDFSSIMTNFRTRFFMKGMDYDSAQIVSRSLGKIGKPSYSYMRGPVIKKDTSDLLDPSQIMNLPENKMIVFSPVTLPFVADKVSIYDTGWLKTMKVPAPTNMREYYRKWGMNTEPLRDPVLPTKNGHYDLERIKSDKQVKIDASITPEFLEAKFRERGGGVYRKTESKQFVPMDGGDSHSDDSPDDLMLFGSMEG